MQRTNIRENLIGWDSAIRVGSHRRYNRSHFVLEPPLDRRIPFSQRTQAGADDLAAGGVSP